MVNGEEFGEKRMAQLGRAFGLTSGGVISLVGAGGKTSLMFRLAGDFVAAGESVLTTTTTKIMMPTRIQASKVVLIKSLNSVLAHAQKFLVDDHHVFAASMCMPDFPGKLLGFSAELIDQIWDSGLFRWMIVEADGAAKRPLKVPADHEPVIPPSSNYVIGVVGLKALGKPVHENWVFRSNRFSQITGLRQGDLVTEASVIEVALHEEGLFKGAPLKARKILFLNAAESFRGINSAQVIANGLKAAKRGAVIDKIVVGKPLENPPVFSCYDPLPSA